MNLIVTYSCVFCSYSIMHPKPPLHAQETYIACIQAALQEGATQPDQVDIVCHHLLYDSLLR